MTDVGLSPRGSLPGNNDEVFKTDPPASKSDSSCRNASVNVRFRHFARAYVVDQLRKHDFEELATKHATFEEHCCDDSQRMLHHLAGNLAEERKRQFEDILNRLQLTSENLSETYRTIVKEMFVDGVNWGRILAFLVFAGSLAVFCARENMGNRVGEVISWTENDVEKTVSKWVIRQGGWAAFVDHFDDSWTIENPGYVVASVLLSLVGIFLLKKLF